MRRAAVAYGREFGCEARLYGGCFTFRSRSEDQDPVGSECF